MLCRSFIVTVSYLKLLTALYLDCADLAVHGIVEVQQVTLQCRDVETGLKQTGPIER